MLNSTRRGAAGLRGRKDRALTYSNKGTAMSQLLEQYQQTDLAEIASDIDQSPARAGRGAARAGPPSTA